MFWIELWAFLKVLEIAAVSVFVLIGLGLIIFLSWGGK